MKTAIYGPSGAGKTTMATMLWEGGDTMFLDLDKEIRQLDAVQDDRLFTFREHLGLELFGNKNAFFNQQSSTQKTINYNTWSHHILYNPSIRTRFEDMLFYDVFLPKIKNIESVIVDGLLPRFVKMYPFDQVIYVTAPEHIRRRNLSSRGVIPSRINEIISLQSKMDWSI